MIARRLLRTVLVPALALAFVAGPGAHAQIGELPERMAVPPEKPEGSEDGSAGNEAETPETTPLPEPRPPAPNAPAADDVPVPEAADAPEAEIPPIPAEETACRQRLRDMGVAFTEHPPISEPEGCEAAYPLSVTRLPGGVELRPEAVLTCAMAEATAGFVRDHAAPRAREEFGSGLAAIVQVSSYVCRPRAGGGKLSEHAFANALDWGALELEDGTVIDVRSHRRAEPRRARLIAGLRDAACGPFKTVLGPGSDADHADHFHFDLAQRRGGGVWCQ